LRVDAPIDLGPAAQLAAGTDGVLIRTKTDHLVWTAFELPKGRPPAEPIDAEAISTIPAPAITRGSRAYWVSHGRLVRRDFSRSAPGQAASGPLQVLTSDAYDATRVAARTITAGVSRDLVAYIARPLSSRGDRRARIWVENAAEPPDAGGGGRSFDLSDEGSGASSVALAGSATRTWAVTFDARVAMSPVHVRTIDFVDGDTMRLGQDVVVFVGEAESSHTEIEVVISNEEPIALAALPRDAGSFGLALIAFGREPILDSPAAWTMYPNGIKPALVAVGHLCGGDWIAYARPTESTPGAPSILALAPLEGVALGAELTVAEAVRFTSLAFAPSPDEATAKRKAGWLAWSADGASRACALRCK